MNLVGKQFQWLFGGNPFSKSLMYGEGYDFPPHFAYCLKDLVGALPVGMDCMSGDDPNWSATNTATYKEIWVEPVNRFMGALSIYLAGPQIIPDEEGRKQDTRVKIRTGLTTAISKKIILQVSVNRDLDLLVRTFNLETETGGQQITLDETNNRELPLEMNIIDPGKPYVLILVDAQDLGHRWEMTGAMVNPIF
jgi:hypothetical protein